MDEESVRAAVDGVVESFMNPRAWSEKDHPRDDAGRFAPPGSGSVLTRARDLAKLSMKRKAARKEARSERNEKERKRKRIGVLVRQQLEDILLGRT